MQGGLALPAPFLRMIDHGRLDPAVFLLGLLGHWRLTVTAGLHHPVIHAVDPAVAVLVHPPVFPDDKGDAQNEQDAKELRNGKSHAGYCNAADAIRSTVTKT